MPLLPGFEFGFSYIIFLKEFSSSPIPSFITDCLKCLRGNDSQLAGECAAPTCVQGEGSSHPSDTYLLRRKPEPGTGAVLVLLHPGGYDEFS